MKKRSIALIIGLMGFALLGVTAMQLYFLRNSYQMQSELFDRSVNEALDNVVARVSRQDALNFLNRKTREGNNKPAWEIRHDNTVNNKDSADNSAAIHKSTPGRHKLSGREKKIALWRDSLKRMILHKRMDDEMAHLLQGGSMNLQIHYEEFTDEYGNVHGSVTPVLVRNPAPVLAKNQKLHKYDTIRYTYIDPQFGKQVISIPHLNLQWQQDQERKQKEKQLRAIKKILEQDSLQNTPPGKTQVIENLAEEYGKYGEPLKMRLNPFWIDTLLRYELHNKGIDLPFSYEVMTANSDSLIFAKANDVTGSKPNLTTSPFTRPKYLVKM